MISVQISLQDPVFIVFRYTPRNGIAGSQSSSSIFDFLRNLCTFFHSKCIFYSPTNRASIILISLHLHQHFPQFRSSSSLIRALASASYLLSLPPLPFPLIWSTSCSQSHFFLFFFYSSFIKDPL